MKGKSVFNPAILLAGGFAAAGWLVYSRRTRERIPGQEELEDPQVTHAFTKIAQMPQMRLLRWYAAQRALNLVNFGHAVDLGCGPGFLVLEMAQQAPDLQVTGIDLSEEMLAQAKGYTHEFSVAGRVDFKVGDAELLAARMSDLIKTPEKINVLRNNIKSVREFQDELADIIGLDREISEKV